MRRFLAPLVALAALAWASSALATAPTCTVVGTTHDCIFTTVEAATWTLSSQGGATYNAANSKICVQSGGGNGLVGASGAGGIGGGGGGNSCATNVSLGSTAQFQVGLHNAGNSTTAGASWFNNSAFVGSSVAVRGTNSSSGAAIGSCVGTCFGGGNAGSTAGGTSRGGSGGGGAAGPGGAGALGGTSGTTAGGAGAQGGNGAGGLGGAGGTTSATAGNGASGTDITSAGAGAGSGGGGGGSALSVNLIGGNGGACGGGGGGAFFGGTAGTGGDGCIEVHWVEVGVIHNLLQLGVGD
jgi:hypothetical protein